MTSGTEKLHFTFYSILVNFNLNSHFWLVIAILDSAALEFFNIPTYIYDYYFVKMELYCLYHAASDCLYLMYDEHFLGQFSQYYFIVFNDCVISH